MVPRNKLPPSREKLLNTNVRRDDFPGLTQERPVSQKTIDEMKAGRESIALAVAEQAANSGILFLHQRYGTPANQARYQFRTNVSKSAVENVFYIELLVFDTHRPPVPVRPPILSHTEVSHKFISEELLTKIIMVCG